ncbi:hypothetical protein ANCCAN_15389 [Ancylostoma caninum]|uniref:Protein kinase domain-containing protein n=1 Tax=Ancylostoma caninum TaxID=29170 RepID=A0A368G2K8_ANCCA|nr:hypothetical protein ANCCAN_15389 [Ancylostoma caninum]
MGRPHVNLQLTSIISGKYIACRKLGEGGCGVIYEVALIESPHRRFACKAEDMDSGREEEILKMEAKVMKRINDAKSVHCPQWIESGKFDNYNFLIMTLLGPSVSDLRKIIPTQKFTLFTVIVIAVQALDSLREVHNAGYIHRDVKPSNYAIGETGTPKEKLIYILDFGLARSYRKVTKDGKVILRNPRRTAQFRGTNRYCSINAHAREEQGRQDDLWSLFYMLVEMLIGSLPWKNMTDHASTEREKTEKEPELLEQTPKEFELYLTHIKQLSYGITPDYTLLRNIFFQVFKKNNFNFSMKLDWEKTGEHGKLYNWNTCSLPRVTTKDTTVVTLEQLLKMPKNLVEITEDMAMKTQDREWYATNSSQDDTIETTKEESQRNMPETAEDSPGQNKSYEKKQNITPRYQSAEKEAKYKPAQVIPLKYEKQERSTEFKSAGSKDKSKEEKKKSPSGHKKSSLIKKSTGKGSASKASPGQRRSHLQVRRGVLSNNNQTINGKQYH